MKFLSVRDLKTKSSQVLTAFRRASATNAVASIQYESTQKGTDKISLDEINAEIGAVRSMRSTNALARDQESPAKRSF
jgi:hypothetical protein